MSTPSAQRKEYADHGGDDRSSTEVGEPLMGGGFDKPWRSEDGERKTRAGKLCAALASWRWLIDTCLLLVIIGLLLDRRRHDQTSPQFQTNGDLTGFAPQSRALPFAAFSHGTPANRPVVGQQIKTFKPDSSYAPENATEFFTKAVQQKWIDLVPSRTCLDAHHLPWN
jgi:hypothetical protein